MINNFRIKMLINMNFFVVENIDLIIIIRKRHIDNCYVTFEFTITFSLKAFIKQNVIFEKSILISIRFYIIIFIKRVKLFLEDYMFEFISECFIILFIVIINSSFHAILIRNDFEQIIRLF